jgi:beta-lactamase regulating signal transducer with metallopeptidase domain
MNLVIEGLNRFSADWWKFVVHTSWQAAIVGLVVLALVQLLGQRWPAPLRYALLVLALLKFACPPLLPVPTGVFSQFASIKIVPPDEQERKPTQAIGPRAAELARTRSGGLFFSQAAAGARALVRAVRTVQWTAWLMILHALGSAFVVGLVLRQLGRLRALARSSRLLRGGTLYRDLVLQLGLKRFPDLATSDTVDGPIAYGVRKPAILLPAHSLARLSPTELKAVLAHELAHCQRGDLWLNWVQIALVTLWWFHPILWLVHWSLRDIREDCCDDLLLARGLVSNDAYCDVLLRAASQMSPAFGLRADLGLGERVHPLGRRMARITDWSLKRADQVSAIGATIILVGAALLWPGLKSREVPAGAASDKDTSHSVTESGHGPGASQTAGPDRVWRPRISWIEHRQQTRAAALQRAEQTRSARRLAVASRASSDQEREAPLSDAAPIESAAELTSLAPVPAPQVDSSKALLRPAAPMAVRKPFPMPAVRIPARRAVLVAVPPRGMFWPARSVAAPAALAVSNFGDRGPGAPGFASASSSSGTGKMPGRL